MVVAMVTRKVGERGDFMMRPLVSGFMFVTRRCRFSLFGVEPSEQRVHLTVGFTMTSGCVMPPHCYTLRTWDSRVARTFGLWPWHCTKSLEVFFSCLSFEEVDIIVINDMILREPAVMGFCNEDPPTTGFRL